MTIQAAVAPHQAQSLIARKMKAPPMNRRRSQRLADTLVRLGRLDRDQVDQVMTAQGKHGGPFGKMAVKLGVLKRPDLEYALGAQLGFLHETTERVVIPMQLDVLRNPYSKHAQKFCQMRTRMCTSLQADRLKMFSIAAAGDGIDAGYIAANLAASFAQLDRKVLLVDANLRTPTLAKIFGAPDAPGVCDIVQGKNDFDSIERETLVKHLALLPAGNPALDPQPILGDDEFKNILAIARDEYDIVIVLTSPFGKNADGEFVWAASKNVLALAKKNHTRMQSLIDMRKVVRNMSAEIIGAAVLG